MGRVIVGFSSNSDASVRLTYKGDDMRDIKHLSKNTCICVGVRDKNDKYMVYSSDDIPNYKSRTVYRIKIRHNDIDYHIICGASQKFIVSTNKMETWTRLASGWVCPAINMVGFDFSNYRYYINSGIDGVKYEIVDVERRLMPGAERLYNIDVVAGDKPTYNIILESRDENISILTINNTRYTPPRRQ